MGKRLSPTQPKSASHMHGGTAMNHDGANKHVSENKSLQHCASLNGNGAPHLERARPSDSGKAASANNMQTAFDANIRPKLDAIDKVRHHLNGVDIELPAIVVVGDQSSGKSSVLESISGIALPRGGNLVTRCPLQLALRRGPTEAALLSYTDPNDSNIQVSRNLALEDIPAAVEKATDHLAGTNSGVVPALINLRVTTRDAPDLTLIDLPGMVRNPIGDQPADIEKQIKELITKHITGDSKVILCTLPASVDFATQEAIRTSREHDPSGKRTVGVVTKPDRADPGIRDRLEATGAEYLRLDMGYVAVRCRTPEELLQGISAQESREREQKFFREHPELKHIGEEYKGIPALSRKLVQIQDQCIQSHLPTLQKEVNLKLQAAQERMRRMQGVISTDAEAEKCLSGMLEKLHRRLVGLVSASPEVFAGDHKARDLHVAPRVNEMLEKYTDQLWHAVGGREFFKTQACHDMLKEHSVEVRGVTLPNFVGDRVFNGIFAEAIYSNLKPSAKDLVHNVHKYMEEVLWKLIEDVAEAFPRLKAAMKALVQEELEALACLATTNAMYIVKGEKHVFTNNGSYMTLLDKMKAHVRQEDNPKDGSSDTSSNPKDEDLENLDVLKVGESNNEQALVDLQLSLAAYTQVVVKNLGDSIPKLVYAQLVGKVTKSLTSMIRDGLCTVGDTRLIDYMHDPQRVAAYRQLQEVVENLKKAHAALRKL
ncbi:hypothetical protein ABBQ38_013050 [Trebouxia sp. C0009 RCD-2024]